MAEGRACTASKETEDFMSHQRGIKRTRTGFGSTESAEPEIKRSSFKLQPAILIHGQTKSQAKGQEQSEKTSNKCKFLQPSKLQAPPSFRTEQGAHTSGDVPAQTGTGTFVSSCNPFLMASNADESSQDETEDTEAAETKPAATEAASKDDKNGGTAATDVLAAAKKEPGKSESSEFGASTFGAKSSSSGTSGFVFGQNFSERAKGGAEGSEPIATTSTFSLAKKPTFSSPTKAKPVEFGDGAKTVPDVSAKTAESSAAASLEESAAAHFAAAESRDIIPEVQVVTGEEDEKNVLMIQCKLYQFNTSSQNWVERGMGNLHLNDHKFTGVDGHFQSRLVMRAHGSLRLVLNTKIWSGMTVDRASKKSIRVSAQCGEEIGVFLIVSTTINDAEQIYRALEYRVLHQKQWDEENPDKAATSSSKSDAKNEQDKGKKDKEKNSSKNDEESTAAADDVKSLKVTTPTKSEDDKPVKSDNNNKSETSAVASADKTKKATATTATTAASDDSKTDSSSSTTTSSSSSSSSDSKNAASKVACNSNGDSND